MRRLLVAALAFLLAGAATRTDGGRRELTVFAAASLREAFEDLARTFEAQTPGVKVRLNFAGSQELRTQIEHGARADVFASANQKQMGELEKAGLVHGAHVFARNQPVVVVPRDNPAQLASLRDLPRARKLVIGVAEVPIGRYTLRLLDRAGADFEKRVLARVASRELDVRQVLAKVILGEADAAIVYRTDALAGKDRVKVIDIPPAVNVVAEYPVAVLAHAPHAADARAFVHLLLSPAGQQRLAAAGFPIAP